jgi:Putative addiction module component
LPQSQAEIDKLWALEAEKRVADIEAGEVRPIPGEEVFERIKKS